VNPVAVAGISAGLGSAVVMSLSIWAFFLVRKRLRRNDGQPARLQSHSSSMGPANTFQHEYTHSAYDKTAMYYQQQSPVFEAPVSTHDGGKPTYMLDSVERQSELDGTSDGGHPYSTTR
jgi:hypothetical protein